MPAFRLVTVVLVLLPSLVCLPSLWAQRDSIGKRLFWTCVLLVPVVGPILYGGMYHPPSVKPKHLRAPPSYGGGGYLDWWR